MTNHQGPMTNNHKKAGFKGLSLPTNRTVSKPRHAVLDVLLTVVLIRNQVRNGRCSDFGVEGEPYLFTLPSRTIPYPRGKPYCLWALVAIITLFSEPTVFIADLRAILDPNIGSVHPRAVFDAVCAVFASPSASLLRASAGYSKIETRYEGLQTVPILKNNTRRRRKP